VLPARHQVQGAEPLDLGGVGADHAQPGLGVQVTGGPAAADPVVEGDLGHAQVGGQVAQPPLMLGQRRAAGRDAGALDAQGPQQVADGVRGEGRDALGWLEALGVEVLGDLRDSTSAAGQLASPGGELGVVAELGQAGHRAGDPRTGAVPARPDDLHVHLFAGPEHGDADLLD